LLNARDVSEWLRAASESSSVLHDYRMLLTGLRAAAPARGAAGSSVRHILADRAFEAEHAVRRLVNAGLGALNTLRESGRTTSAWTMTRKHHARGVGAKELRSALTKWRESARGAPGVEACAWAAIEEFVAETDLRVQWGDGMAYVTCTVAGETRHLSVPAAAPRIGQPLVSAGTLLGASVEGPRALWFSTGLASASHLGAECREPAGAKRATSDIVVDPYAAAITALSTAREAFYRHAREVQELGIGGIRGSGPLAVAIIALCLIVGITLAIAGSEYLRCQQSGDNDHCVFAALLVVFGLAAAFVAATFRSDLVQGAFAADGLRLHMSTT
jgi:hypothetical protein